MGKNELREALRSAEDLHLTDAELDDLFEDLGVKDSGGLRSVLSYEVPHEIYLPCIAPASPTYLPCSRTRCCTTCSPLAATGAPRTAATLCCSRWRRRRRSG